MKKEIIFVMAAGLLLLAACGPKEGVGPVQLDNDGKTPTPIVVPTCTPMATPSPVPGLHPTAAPTNTKAPTATTAPTETPTPSPEPTPMPTATAAPTETLTPTPGPEPTTAPTETLTPTPEPTVAPTTAPTETLTPTPSPEPTPMPTATTAPSPSPTPTINPEPLVANGWQKTVSIDENYMIVFPEVFRNAEVSKTDRELVSAFYSDEHPDVEFKIIYIMQQRMEMLVYDILAVGGSITEDRPEEQRITCMWQVGNTVYHSVFIDVQYPQSLLGAAFGEEEWVAGVMQVVFSYPADIRDIYETEQYSFHVVYSGEE